jgi:aspartyl-tRNA(Asn)/glutamyl-tRNA(Gln) amidotransferase subunit B
MPELPDERVRRYTDEWRLPHYDADVLTAERGVAEYFEATIKHVLAEAPAHAPAEAAKAVSNFIMTHALRTLKDDQSPATAAVEPGRMAGIIRMRLEDRISSTGAQEIFEAMLEETGTAEEIAASRNLIQVKDRAALLPFVEKVLREHPDNVDMYVRGKKGLIGFFIGQVMQICPGSPDPREVRSLLEERFEAMQS